MKELGIPVIIPESSIRFIGKGLFASPSSSSKLSLNMIFFTSSFVPNCKATCAPIPNKGESVPL